MTTTSEPTAPERADLVSLTIDDIEVSVPKGTLIIRAAAPVETAILAARRGDAVTITLRSEIAAELHLHGYDLEARLSPGATATWRFAARATGRYPINVHRPGASTGHRQTTPIAYLEVRPR